jgi:Bacterial capsule synthesis protein PGA_cap
VIGPLVLLGMLAAAYARADPLPSLEPDEPPVRLAFAGDLSMSLFVGLHLEAQARGEGGVEAGYPFAGVADRVARADLAVGNLECVVSPLGAPIHPEKPGFRAPDAAIGAILGAGFDLVSVANNHVLDEGPDAYDDMLRRLDAGGLARVGVGRRSVAPEEPVVREIRGRKIGFFAFYNVDVPKACRDVARARDALDLIVVFNHWGQEGQISPFGYQQGFGRCLVDAGADLVVGTHAHVIQPEEWYRGKLIFYGLGNFVFSGMGFDEPHRTGGFLEVDLGRRGVVARRLYRVRLDDTGAPRWVDGAPILPERI